MILLTVEEENETKSSNENIPDQPAKPCKLVYNVTGGQSMDNMYHRLTKYCANSNLISAALQYVLQAMRSRLLLPHPNVSMDSAPLQYLLQRSLKRLHCILDVS